MRTKLTVAAPLLGWMKQDVAPDEWYHRRAATEAAEIRLAGDLSAEDTPDGQCLRGYTAVHIKPPAPINLPRVPIAPIGMHRA